MQTIIHGIVHPFVYAKSLKCDAYFSWQNQNPHSDWSHLECSQAHGPAGRKFDMLGLESGLIRP